MKVQKLKQLVIASIIVAFLSIIPVSMAYAQNTTAKNHIEGSGYSTKVSIENSVDTSKLKNSPISPNTEAVSGIISLDAYNMAPRLPRTMEAAWTAESFIGPISYVQLKVTFDDNYAITDEKSVWYWFSSSYSNATQHQFATAGEHGVSIYGFVRVDAGLYTITYPSYSTSCELTN